MKRSVDRIGWQRSAGHFLYSEIAEAVFPNLPDIIGPWELEAAASEFDSVQGQPADIPDEKWLPPMIASMAIEHAAKKAIFEIPEVEAVLAAADTTEMRRSHDKYTINTSIKLTTEEAVVTAGNFPTATLYIADQLRTGYFGKDSSMPTAHDVHRVAGGQNFSELIHSMAFAPNSFWHSRYTSDPGRIIRGSDSLATYVPLDDVKEDGSELGITIGQTAQRAALRLNNARSTDERAITHHTVFDQNHNALGTGGASRGCPVAVDAPSWNGPIGRRAKDQVAQAFAVPEHCLDVAREHSGLQLGLNAYVEVLGRTIAYFDRADTTLRY